MAMFVSSYLMFKTCNQALQCIVSVIVEARVTGRAVPYGVGTLTSLAVGNM